MNEQEMREAKVPTLESPEQLIDYIRSLTEREHDYGTCVYAASMAAVAAFNHVASRLGMTGFQASCADLDIIRRTRRLACPFAIIKGDDLLYPQYDIEGRVRELIAEWMPWARDEARRMLAENPGEHVHESVRQRWVELSGREELK